MKRLCNKNFIEISLSLDADYSETNPADLLEKGNTFLFFSLYFYLFFNIYIIDYALTVVPFPPLHSPPPCIPPPSHIPPPHSSCPWVIHINSLASTFPILFLPSPCLFSSYHLCYLFSVPFPPPHPLLIILHVISISVVLFLF